MMEIPVSEAGSQLDDLVRYVTHNREAIALTDGGEVAALLVSPRVMEDLEEALAQARAATVT